MTGDMNEEAGHRLLPHPADVALEAWGPGRAECVAEAVRALVESFVDLGAAAARQTVALPIGPCSDDDLLINVLEEAIFQVEEYDRVPVDVEIEEESDGGFTVHFAVAPVSRVQLIGAVPIAIASDGLELRRVGGGWRCHVTLDV